MAVALVLALFFQLAEAAPRNSVTFDEGQHITRGYVYLKTGDLRLQRFQSAHPPGMAMLEAALSLWLPAGPDPTQLGGWKKADTLRLAKQLVWDSPDIERLMFAARVPVMLVVALLAAFVFRWASDLSRALRSTQARALANGGPAATGPSHTGTLAGLAALALCAFDPNLIAHGMLATTDAGVTAFSFMALYWLWKSLRRPSPGALAAAGVTLGLALLAKMTALFLLPVSMLLALALGMAKREGRQPAHMSHAAAAGERGQWPRLAGLAARLAAIYGIGFLLVWGAYGFEIGLLPGWPIPVPAATHFSSLVRAREHLDTGHVTFLMGQVAQRGWWYYFPVAFLIKTPVPTLLLLAPAIFYACRNSQARRAALPLGLFGGAYAGVALFSDVNIGYRHLLPLLPCLFVLAAQAADLWPLFTHRMSKNLALWRFALPAAGGLLAAWYIAGAVGLFPNYLTFFNELIGGPKNGYKYLVDSNLDWGQSLVELRRYMAQNGLGRVRLSATGYANPASYGIAYDPLPPMPDPQPIARLDPEPGRYYIGAHNLQIGSPLDHDVFGWFREREPDEWIGNAILVYDVAERPAGNWVAQCGADQIEPEMIAEGMGRGDLRFLYFDCQAGWVYPADAPGWYLIGDDAAPGALCPVYGRDGPACRVGGTFTREFRTGGLSGVHFTLYRLQSAPEYTGLSTQVSAASRDEDTRGTPLSAPATVGPLTFLGFTLDHTRARPGQTVMLTTYWRVAVGLDRLASFMAHVVTADGQVVANGDGLGVPVDNWRPGDVLVQRHALVIPPGAPPGQYQTQTGLYTLDGGHRFEVTSGSAVVGNRLLLAPIEIE